MCDKQIKDLIDVFSSTTDVKEEKMKCLFVVPLLQYCYLKLGKTLKDVFSDFIFDKEGEGKGDIRIKISPSVILLVETKGKKEDLLKEVKSKIIWPGPYELQSSYSDYLFIDNEDKFYNLNNDYFGQILRYALQQAREAKDYSEIRVILTNGIKWHFFRFNREELDSLIDNLRKGKETVIRKEKKNGEKKIVEKKTVYGCSIKNFKEKINKQIELSLDKCGSLLKELQDYMKA